jgi:hypothetical protein
MLRIISDIDRDLHFLADRGVHVGERFAAKQAAALESFVATASHPF